MSKYARRWDNKTQADLDDLEARLSGGDISLTYDVPTLFALVRGWQAVALREAARDTKARGDIGKEGGVEAWDYLHARADRLLGVDDE